MPLNIADTAPIFSASDQSGTLRNLSEYKGKWLLLYFYPKDDTPGCTVEAKGFRDRYASMKDRVAVVGVSGDGVESHRKFAVKYELPFTLLADPDRKIIAAYGADGLIFPKRVSFLISPEGRIEKIYAKVTCEIHAGEVEQDLRVKRAA